MNISLIFMVNSIIKIGRMHVKKCQIMVKILWEKFTICNVSVYLKRSKFGSKFTNFAGPMKSIIHIYA